MTAPRPTVRVAAVGDVHVGVGDDTAPLALGAGDADLLLVAGDLTRCGTVDEAAAAAQFLSAPGVPTVAVLGNHDHHDGHPEAVTRRLTEAGICVLEQERTVVDVQRDGAVVRVGIVGAKGFGGGFADAHATDFGEPEMKAFVAHTRGIAEGVAAEMDALDADVRVVLLHYSPTAQTLGSEPREIHPFLGSYLLAAAVDDHGGADLVLHGHAHRGNERGWTPGGSRVRNVARPVLRRSHACYEL